MNELKSLLHFDTETLTTCVSTTTSRRILIQPRGSHTMPCEIRIYYQRNTELLIPRVLFCISLMSFLKCDNVVLLVEATPGNPK